MTDRLSKHIGAQLQAARQHQNLTQLEVAERAGTNTNYYAKLERGEAIPSLKMLGKIAKALNLRASDLLPF